MTSVFWLAGCGLGTMSYRVPVRPPQGALVTVYRAPLTTNFSNTPVGKREGRASVYYIRDPFISYLDFSWGDADIKTAAQNGRLMKVEYADYEIIQVLGIFGKMTVVVWGK